MKIDFEKINVGRWWRRFWRILFLSSPFPSGNCTYCGHNKCCLAFHSTSKCCVRSFFPCFLCRLGFSLFLPFSASSSFLRNLELLGASFSFCKARDARFEMLYPLVNLFFFNKTRRIFHLCSWWSIFEAWIFCSNFENFHGIFLQAEFQKTTYCCNYRFIPVFKLS